MAKKPTAKTPKPAKKTQTGEFITTLAGETVPAAELAHITPDLRPLAVRVDSLTPDPRNARLHSEQNFQATVQSLHDNGQLKPISTDADGVILAGNNTYAAAKSLGWTWIARARCNLTGPAARRWAIQDNRSGELAAWDQAELQNHIAQLEADLADFKLEGIGFTPEQIDALLKDVPDVKTAHGFASATKTSDDNPANFQPQPPESQPRLDQRKPVTCPNCQHEFIPEK